MTTKITRPRGYVSLATAAESLGVTQRTLARWCQSGQIKGARREESAGKYGFRWVVPASWVARQDGAA